MPNRKPHTEKEALRMILCGWKFLLFNKASSIVDVVKKSFYWPLTLYMLFGGAIFSYKYFISDTFEIEKAVPIGELRETPSLFPKAYAGSPSGVPIYWNRQLWGYEDTTFVAKVGKGEPTIFVYDKKTREVFKVYFKSSTDYRQQMRK